MQITCFPEAALACQLSATPQLFSRVGSWRPGRASWRWVLDVNRVRSAVAVVLSAAATASVIYLASRPKRKSGFPSVRNAGPENMQHPPEDWDRTDQAVDESFPPRSAGPLHQVAVFLEFFQPDSRRRCRFNVSEPAPLPTRKSGSYFEYQFLFSHGGGGPRHDVTLSFGAASARREA